MGRLHHIISGVAVVLAPKNVSESHWFGELSGFHQEASSICVPGIGHGKLQGKKSGFKVSKVSRFQGFNFSKGDAANPQICGWNLCELIVNLRVGGRVVNSQIVVQPQKRSCGFYDKPKHAKNLY
jgi:hypothetical protein